MRELAVAFGGVRALAGVSFDVARGAVLGLIGPNGAGKTTLLNCLTGIYRPTEGELRFEGRSITGLPPHRVAALGIARTFQNIELFSYMTVLDNVLCGRHLHGRTGPLAAMRFGRRVVEEEVAQRRRAEEVLERLDLEFARERLVVHLPYGVRKRVELARALALEPRLLLCDEPSAGMNAEEKEDLFHVIGDLRDELGITIVLVEHDMGLVMGMCDRIVVLDHGAKIAEGTPDEVTRDPAVVRAYLGGARA